MVICFTSIVGSWKKNACCLCLQKHPQTRQHPRICPVLTCLLRRVATPPARVFHTVLCCAPATVGPTMDANVRIVSIDICTPTILTFSSRVTYYTQYINSRYYIAGTDPLSTIPERSHKQTATTGLYNSSSGKSYWSLPYHSQRGNTTILAVRTSRAFIDAGFDISLSQRSSPLVPPPPYTAADRSTLSPPLSK